MTYERQRLKFCESLREHIIEITHYQKKKMMTLTNKELKSYPNQESYHIYKKKKLEEKYADDKKLS